MLMSTATLRTFLFSALCAASALTAVSAAAPGVARADECYLCGSGSTANCKDYCRYGKTFREDTFEARKACEKRGCKVSGTGSCPTAANYKVCRVEPAQTPGTAVAAIDWCVPTQG